MSKTSRRASRSSTVDVSSSASKRRSHRSGYPTPLFKAFAALLNFLALPIAMLWVNDEPNMTNGALTLVALIGSGIALYANFVKPLATNVRFRKMLTAVAIAYGTVALLALGFTYLLTR